MPTNISSYIYWVYICTRSKDIIKMYKWNRKHLIKYLRPKYLLPKMVVLYYCCTCVFLCILKNHQNERNCRHFINNKNTICQSLYFRQLIGIRQIKMYIFSLQLLHILLNWNRRKLRSSRIYNQNQIQFTIHKQIDHLLIAAIRFFSLRMFGPSIFSLHYIPIVISSIKIDFIHTFVTNQWTHFVPYSFL